RPAFDTIWQEMAKNPNLNSNQARELIEKLPEGPVRNLGRALANTAEPEHAAPHRPEPGIDRPGAPERQPTTPTQPEAGQMWHNQGTEFRDVPGRPVEFTGSDGKTYSIGHEANPNHGEGDLGSHAIRIKDANGEVVAWGSAWNRKDGNIEL